MQTRVLLDAFEQAYSKKSWHGPNLRGSIRGVTAAEAVWRPQPGRHNIAEQVLHAAYWKYTVRRRLRGEKPGTFPLKGNNWFPVSALNDREWKKLGGLLETEHAALRDAIALVASSKLYQNLPGAKVTYFALISGIAAHDAYHAGQIQLIKSMMRQQD